jgi:hypothetical protein
MREEPRRDRIGLTCLLPSVRVNGATVPNVDQTHVRPPAATVLG